MSSSTSTAATLPRAGDAYDGKCGIPVVCQCGAAIIRRTSKTSKNTGRLFYCCTRVGESSRGHLFKWKDESLIEEVEELKSMVGKCVALTGNNENTAVKQEKQTGGSDIYLCGCESLLQELRVECQRLKQIFVDAFVGFLCYLWFSS